ncbi:S66 peptidase family protein [Haliangium ochraceum]|uniref:S66 peptidase family protein n=1 Tax=Haliangium ochraceum TaxID=80816 RepID=UPI0005D4810E|nr:LD-carboxypeptidase [Haliangium ochraceum]
MASTAVLPPALRPDDTVAVCAPAGPVAADQLRAGAEVLASRYRVHIEPAVLARAGYLAGGDARRADSFNRCLRDPDVRAILCARGGYGIMRILADLDADALRRDPKLIIGFSDATALLAWAMRSAGVRAIHGPMVGQLGTLPANDAEWLFRLMESTAPLPLPDMGLAAIGAPLPLAPVEGPLVGGNLCLLSHLVGTPYQLDLRDSLLWFEDVGEVVYRIDRYLTHLGLAGVLDGVRAAVVGDMTACVSPVGHPSAFAVIHERLSHWGLAAAYGAPLAHGVRNVALPMGAHASLSRAGQDIRLELHEAAVA